MEDHEIRLKRLRMRCWRRGMKEMDLILGPFADRELAALAPDELALFETLLNENDQDLYAWISARIAGTGMTGPAALDPILRRVSALAMRRFAQNRDAQGLGKQNSGPA